MSAQNEPVAWLRESPSGLFRPVWVMGSVCRMAREYDAQLLESVVVRRARLREAFLWGQSRRQLATVDNLKRFAISVVVAAVLCAGCVGWSFLQGMLAERQAQQATIVGLAA